LEAARPAPRSPFGFAYGGFDVFEDETIAEVQAGKLNPTDMSAVLACFRRWYRVWGGWQCEGDGSTEYGR
jgi:hypothetical protein